MTGLLGRKKGMSALFSNGRYMPVTVLEVGPCPVVQVKTIERDGYAALQLGFGDKKPKHANKAELGRAKNANIAPQRFLKEFDGFAEEHKAGDILKAEQVFAVGDKVDVIALSKGRGFAGVIKRHNFSRPNQSHGTHEIFRGTGSIGQHSYPARTWPGQKMPGRLGGKQITTKNLKVLQIDAEKGLMLIKGAVPGAPGGLVTVRKSLTQG